MQNTTIDIEGMTCDHCVQSVTRIIEGFNGVSSVTVNLSKNEARFTYDADKTSLSEITKAIEEDGYTVKGTR